jgi:hypothetical protein
VEGVTGVKVGREADAVELGWGRRDGAGKGGWDR